mgnify:FL=1
MKEASVLRANALFLTRNATSRMGWCERRSSHRNRPRNTTPKANRTPAHAPEKSQMAPMDNELTASV